MRTATHILQFILIALIVIALGALAGWFFFLRGATNSAQEIDTARGIGSTIPSAQNPAGSTYGNTNASGSISGGAGTSAGGTEEAQRQSLLSRLAGLLTGGRWGSARFDISAGISELLPFGKGGGTAATSTTGTPEAAPRLWRISQTPAAGIGFVGGSTSLYFAERATGNVLKADPQSATIARITNTLVPKTYEALFARDGSVILRSVSASGTLTTFAGFASSTSATSSTTALAGVNLPAGITYITVHPTNRTLLYIVADQTGAVGMQASWSDADRKQVFASRLSNWHVQLLADNRVILTQKPADNVNGFAYEIKNGAFVPLKDNLPGLIVLARVQSPAQLFSTSQNGIVRLFAQVTASATAVELPIRTIAEKCVWAPGTNLIAYCAVPREISTRTYLNDRYRGAAPTSDTWWKVDASAGTAEQLSTPMNEQTVDVWDPIINEAGTHVAFMNARDMSVWMLRISE